MAIRESHFKRDAFGLVRFWGNGKTEICTRPDGMPLRFTSMRDANREAQRLTLLESFQAFASGAFGFRAMVIANDSRVARKPVLLEGTGFTSWSHKFEESLKTRTTAESQIEF